MPIETVIWGFGNLKHPKSFDNHKKYFAFFVSFKVELNMISVKSPDSQKNKPTKSCGISYLEPPENAGLFLDQDNNIEHQNFRPEFWRRVEIHRPLHGGIGDMLVLGRCLMPMASMQTERKCDARKERKGRVFSPPPHHTKYTKYSNFRRIPISGTQIFLS